jgi:hypothetical protein
VRTRTLTVITLVLARNTSSAFIRSFASIQQPDGKHCGSTVHSLTVLLDLTRLKAMSFLTISSMYTRTTSIFRFGFDGPRELRHYGITESPSTTRVGITKGSSRDMERGLRRWQRNQSSKHMHRLVGKHWVSQDLKMFRE